MRKIVVAVFLLFVTGLQAQKPEKWTSSEIYQHIKELNFLGSVLYIGAHPDDENTSLISYFSNKVHAQTAYLSLTRGDGGQNLIGPEIREKLGIIRTQELLAARKVDGGQQFFTRANDFGYSKTPSETLQIWDRKKVLSDMVWVIRKFKPDVIINRFDHRTPGTTHGHHTASAMLSLEAFRLAGDKKAFNDQLNLVETYKPKRLFFNTSPWFYGGSEEFKKADKSNFISFNTGVYYPLKGLSNSEISAISRSNHKSQGFGSSGSRGKQLEYLELLEGSYPKDSIDVFQGIDTSWNRLKGGAQIGEILKKVKENFSFKDPSASVPKLISAYSLIQKLEDGHWKKVKSNEIKDIIYAASGLFLEAVAAEAYSNPGEKVSVALEAINRSNEQITLEEVALTPNDSKISPNLVLKNNEDWSGEITLNVPKNADYTSPYWLKKAGTEGMYKVEDKKLIGLAQNPNTTIASFKLNINGTHISFERPIVYKSTDAVKGEVYNNFELVPPVSIRFPQEVLIFNNNEPKKMQVIIVSKKENIKGDLSFKDLNGWKVSIDNPEFSIVQKGGSKTINFTLTPSKKQGSVFLKPVVKIGANEYDSEIININYEHIPNQSLVSPAKLKLVKLDIKEKGENIAYIEGAGDVMAESLQEIGYSVTNLSPKRINASNLKNFDAVIVGIRAYNVDQDLVYKQPVLLDYVKNGGTLIVQYNTSRGLLTENIAPFNLTISRDRVTEEDAEVKFLAPNHPVLNFPNKISEEDFNGWVQERGLYFPDEWGKQFTPILSMHDKNETPKNGSLLISEYGKGYFVYTGLSFFRQFPAGVPGAYRLFANLIALGK